jgi:hypothetical protein
MCVKVLCDPCMHDHVTISFSRTFVKALFTRKMAGAWPALFRERRRRQQAGLLLLLNQRRNPIQLQPRLWVHQLWESRQQNGEFHTLVPELRRHPDKFFAYFRMSVDSFDELLAVLRPSIQKQNTSFRRSIGAEERLCICLR